MKLVIILEAGEIQYLFSEVPLEVELIDCDRHYLTTGEKEKLFRELAARLIPIDIEIKEE